MGLGRLDAEKALADIARVKAARSGGKISPEQIEGLIADRKAARAAKDFQRADEIRKELLEKGVEIKDGPQGTTWEYR